MYLPRRTSSELHKRSKIKLFARRFAPKCSPRRTSSELHKLSKIENFRSALRAEMFALQELLRATQTFQHQIFSLGASRRNGTQTNKGPLGLMYLASGKGALHGGTTRVHYKGHYKGTLQGSLSKYIFCFPA